MEQTDVLLIENFIEGDITALGILFEKYKRMAYRVAVKITENHEDANDVVQEAFLKVYKSINSFRKQSSFETWLYRIVVNLSLNAVNRRKRRRESLCEAPEGFDQVYGNEMMNSDVNSVTKLLADDDPHLRYERKELRETVTQAVDSLPPKQKVVVILHEFEGLTHPEIASILECSVGTVRSRLHYARKRLRNLLKPYVSG